MREGGVNLEKKGRRKIGMINGVTKKKKRKKEVKIK